MKNVLILYLDKNLMLTQHQKVLVFSTTDSTSIQLYCLLAVDRCSATVCLPSNGIFLTRLNG